MSWAASLECTPFRKNDAQEAAKLETFFTMSDLTSSGGESDFSSCSFFAEEAVAALLTDKPLMSVELSLRCCSPSMEMCGMPASLDWNVQGRKNKEKYVALSIGEVEAFGTLAPCNTGTYGRRRRTITQLWRRTS